jgi:hypothetical protein
MLLLNHFDDAQLLFPCALERARYQTVLGLDGVILAPCPFGLVSGTLSSERPLPFELPALFLQLPHRRECDRNSIRCKCLKEHALDQFIHRQGADLLTQGTASLALVDSTAVDRIIAIRPRVPQAHATPAAPANSDALQQCRAPARRASVPRLVAVRVVCQPPLVGMNSSQPM